MIPPDMVPKATAPANAPGTYDNFVARESQSSSTKKLDTKARAKKYLANAKTRGWKIVHTYSYTADPSGRADGVVYILNHGGVEADLSVETNHQFRSDILKVRVVR